MLRIDRQKQQFSRLEAPRLADASISERYHLQEYICNSPDAFFKEIGEELFLIDKEVHPSDDVQDRIDLLALDKKGQVVVIELKRGNDKLQMFQAISYAAMMSKWQPERLLELLKRRGGDTMDQLENFLEGDEEGINGINRRQRIILVAEAFDYSLLIGAEWLSEQYGVDIICCRLSLAQDAAANAEFVVCSNIFPAPEIVQQAIRRGPSRLGGRKSKWADWPTALAGVGNAALVAYFTRELDATRDGNLRRRSLRYKVGGKRRWVVRARSGYAHVSQQGRFDGDEDFWRANLSRPDQVEPIADGLRFHLSTERDFQFFHEAATQQLVGMNWTEAPEDVELDEEGDGQPEGT